MAEVLSGALTFAAFRTATTGHPIAAGLLCFASSMAKETGVFASLIISLHYFGETKRTHRLRRAVVVPAVAFALFFAARITAFGGSAWTIQPSPQVRVCGGERLVVKRYPETRE